MLKTENVDLEFSEDGIETIANLATEVNSSVENIGARRLHTIIERILDEISFTATDRSGEKIVIDSKYVKENLGQLVKDNDLSKFILIILKISKKNLNFYYPLDHQFFL